MDFQLDNLPWLSDVWGGLSQRIKENRLPHALLFQGINGLGKSILADTLASKLLCHGEGEFACGNCKGCQLMAVGTHPDIFYCSPEEDSKVIKVDQIRAMNEFVSQSGQVSKKKVVVLNPAAALNLNAANALLKCLEEPAGDVVYILLDHLSGRLLPTIRSRCQVIEIRVPPREMLSSWVASVAIDSDGETSTGNLINDLFPISLGAPLAIVELISSGAADKQDKMIAELAQCMKQKLSPVTVTKNWLSSPIETLLLWQIAWIEGLIKYKLTGEDQYLQPRSAHDMFKYLSDIVPSEALYHLREQLFCARQGLVSNLNENLLLEDILIQWRELMSYRKQKTV